jgi:glutathione synthase/RimK-type ligase-like ATP-grasp enzyme
MTKKLLFMNHFEDWNDQIPGVDGLDTLEAYQEMTKIGKRLGIEVYISGYINIHSDTGVVNKAWNYNLSSWVKIETPFKPDLIISKIPARLTFETFELRSALSTQVELINDPGFATFIGDKLNQYLIFPEYMAKTALVKNLAQLNREIENLAGDKVVLKKAFGSGGSKVKILNKKESFEPAVEFLKYPFLVQEFIYSSKGIPGFDKDKAKYPIVADLRMMYIGKELIFAVSRQANNSLFTNVSLGAKIRYIEKEKIPQQGIDICKKIVDKLSIFGKNILAIDLMFDDNGKPFVIEINTKPDPVFNNCAPVDIQKDYLKQLFD